MARIMTRTGMGCLLSWAMIVGLSACSSDSGPTRPPPTPAPWTGEIQIVDQDGIGVPGLLVQVTHATQDLPSKSQNAAGVASDVVEGFTDHDGIARPEETFEVGLLWIHQLRVSTAGGELLHQDTLVTTEQESLGEIDVLGRRFHLDIVVEFQISAAQDSVAAQTILGTWQTAFVDDKIDPVTGERIFVSYGRRLSYHEDGTFDGILTQDGIEFFIEGTWLIRNLILTTTFDFGGELQKHSTRFDVSGTSMTTRGIPAGTARQWEKQ